MTISSEECNLAGDLHSLVSCTQSLLIQRKGLSEGQALSPAHSATSRAQKPFGHCNGADIGQPLK